MRRVAVVGGSVAGLTAACLLRDAGYEVDVYERSPGLLSEYGAGIVVQPESVRYFRERTHIRVEEISVVGNGIRYFNAESGTEIGDVKTELRYTSYTALYRCLLKCYGTDRYHLGHSLVGLEEDGEGVELRFANGRTVHCDLAVCADGGFSTARQRLFGIVPSYSGYVTWRGLTDPGGLSEEALDFLEDGFTYGILRNGHLIAYPVPTIGSDLQVTGRRINWQWYWNVAEGRDLDEIMTGRDGIRRPVSVHADDVQQRYVDELHRRAREELALKPFVELITATERPFVTVIADAGTSRMAVGRICLIGDAAVTGRPHAAASAAKAAADAWALAEALVGSEGDVEAALRRWEPAQLLLGYALLAKVRYMGSVLQSGGPVVPGDPAWRFGLPIVDGRRERSGDPAGVLA